MGQPIRGMTRPLPISINVIASEKLNADFNASIHNRFDVEVIDAKTGEVRQRAQAENVICSQLWTRLFAPNTYFNYIHYGTGTGTPASTDTSLFTFFGYGTPSNVIYNSDPYNGIISVRKQIQLNELTAVGSTLTEVGIGYGSTSATLCTHAMLKDANGNQISIAKTDTDIINIYATVFLHYAAAGYSNQSIVVINAFRNYFSNYTVWWLLGEASPEISVVSIYAGPLTAYSDYGVTSAASAAYSVANKTITITASRLSANSANISGGIKEIAIGKTYNSEMVPFLLLRTGGAWFSGSTITAEAIATGNGSTVDFATSFPLASNATIYVDGVAQSTGVSIDENTGKTNNVGQYFQFLPQYGQTSPTTDGGRFFNAYTTDGKYTSVFYNPLYAKGIDTFYATSASTVVQASDNLADWVTVSTGSSGTINVSTTYKNYKYWKISGTAAYNFYSTAITSYNIHFTTAPASGAVITADYHTPVIAKDSNHVFDLTVTITLSEYTA